MVEIAASDVRDTYAANTCAQEAPGAKVVYSTTRLDEQVMFSGVLITDPENRRRAGNILSTRVG